MARQRMLHPERLPLGGSVTTGVASILAPAPRRDRLHPGAALLIVLLIAVALWYGIAKAVQWLVH